MTLTANDSLSGIASTRYSVNGGAAQTYTGSFLLSGVGTYVVSYASTDKAGNVEAAKTLNVSITQPVDACTTASVLDSFNRANGGVGNNWRGLTDTVFYRIAANRLDVQAGGPIYWNPASFGPNQATFVTLSTIDTLSPSQGVLLKVQDGSVPQAGAISVVYDGLARAVRVSTLRVGIATWTLYANTPVLFANGDKLGACAKADGSVRIYRNNALVTTVMLSATDKAFFNPKGGKVGLWTAAAPSAFFDDFGGGAVTP